MRAIVMLLPLLAITAACTSPDLKRGAYDALHSRQCLQEQGSTDCEFKRQSYEDYHDEREEMLDRSGPSAR